MKQDDVVIEVTKEHVVSGIGDEKNKRYNAATSSFFKALVGLCDVFIFKKTGRFPENHTERFSQLEKQNERIYKIVRRLFRTYRYSYIRLIAREEVRSVRNGIKNVIKVGGLEEEFAEIAEKL